MLYSVIVYRYIVFVYNFAAIDINKLGEYMYKIIPDSNVPVHIEEINKCVGIKEKDDKSFIM
jgi:hypothetical protein